MPGMKAALAVSGGGDSIALMHLYAHWVKQNGGCLPAILIVDHGLREESRMEAATVAGWAEELGFPSHVLAWTGGKPQSNIEEYARTARYRLLGGWCVAHDTSNLFVAHTSDDQVETFLLRLARGSGVDGLSGMEARSSLPFQEFRAVQVLRPLLAVNRTELRAYLPALGAKWIEDPMNEDERFARTRIRKVLPVLEAAGVPLGRIAQAAAHLRRAREALDAAANDFLCCHGRIDSIPVLIDGAAFAKVPREIALRALSLVLLRVGGAAFRPRFERLEAVLDAVLAKKLSARTLSGCRIGRAPKAQAAFGPATLIVTREAERRSELAPSGAATAGPPAPAEAEGGQGSILLPQKGRIRRVR